MQSVMISIKPKWCELIANGQKTIEVRKSKPKLGMPFKCYIYCTKEKKKYALHTYINSGYGRENFGVIGNWRSGKQVVDVNAHLPAYRYNAYLAEGMVIGEFICDTFITDKTFGHDALFNGAACMSVSEAVNYSAGKEVYGWHISDLIIYDRVKELRDFRTICKYRNEDGSCQYQKIDCYCVKFDFNPDGSVNLADCLDHMVRPPQSWCYVEEICI